MKSIDPKDGLFIQMIKANGDGVAKAVLQLSLIHI